jgi:hypothetical protein
VWVSKPGPTFADVLRTFDADYRRRHGAELTEQQDKVLREMLACYTPLLGTHEWTCGDCGTVVELPNGCNNRHCCTCGSTKRWRWAEGICSQILPIEYAHVILTLPKQITQLAMINQSELYSLVLREGAYTVLEGGKRLFDIELGLLTLLHTWGQLLLAHVHSHCLLPLGGLRQNTLEWMNLSQNQLDQLLEYVRREFPKRFCKALRKAFQKGSCSSTATRSLSTSRHRPSSSAGSHHWRTCRGWFVAVRVGIAPRWTTARKQQRRSFSTWPTMWAGWR